MRKRSEVKRPQERAPVEEESATKHVMIRISPEFHRALRRFALEEGRSLSSVILEFVREGWKRVPNRERYEEAPGGKKTAPETSPKPE
jgi:hypothetical protein